MKLDQVRVSLTITNNLHNIYTYMFFLFIKRLLTLHSIHSAYINTCTINLNSIEFIHKHTLLIYYIYMKLGQVGVRLNFAKKNLHNIYKYICFFLIFIYKRPSIQYTVHTLIHSIKI